SALMIGTPHAPISVPCGLGGGVDLQPRTESMGRTGATTLREVPDRCKLQQREADSSGHAHSQGGGSRTALSVKDVNRPTHVEGRPVACRFAHLSAGRPSPLSCDAYERTLNTPVTPPAQSPRALRYTWRAQPCRSGERRGPGGGPGQMRAYVAVTDDDGYRLLRGPAGIDEGAQKGSPSR